MCRRTGARSVAGVPQRKARQMQRHRLTSVHSLLLAGAVSGALAAPAPALVARDATVSAAPVRATIDLRSPDARDAGRPVAFDLRSPDAALPVSLPAAQ